MSSRSVFQVFKSLVIVLALGIGTPWAFSGEDVGSSVADWDGDGKVSAAEQGRYDWIADQLDLDDRGLRARSNDAEEGRGGDLELPADAKYLRPEEWRTLAQGAGQNRSYEPLMDSSNLIAFGDKKGPLPVEFWATADGFERHVFTAEVRIQPNKKDDPSDDVYLIDVYDPSRDHGSSDRPKGEIEPIREDFNRFVISGETVEPEGKKRPKTAFGDAYQIIAGENIHNGNAAVVFSVGPFAESAYALTVSRTARGELRGQLWISRVFKAEQRQLRDEVEAAKRQVRAELETRGREE